MSTALTQHPWELHGLCGDFSWAPPTYSGKKGEKQLPQGVVTAPDIRVDNDIPVILGLPLNAASALLFSL